LGGRTVIVVCVVWPGAISTCPGAKANLHWLSGSVPSKPMRTGALALFSTATWYLTLRRPEARSGLTFVSHCSNGWMPSTNGAVAASVL
jgi:hypothetical protein